jgi:hypothetical protein
MAEVQMPDGSIARIPDFALESTQQKMHNLIMTMVKNNSSAQLALQNINKSTLNAASSDKKISEQALREQQQQTKLLNEQVKKNNDFRSVFSSRLESDMTKVFVGTGNILTGLAQGALAASAAITGVLLKSFMDAGNSLRQLSTVGLGNVGLVNTITSFTDLGMSAGQAAEYLTRFSASTVVLGRTNFSRFVANMAQSAALSSDLALTFQESIDVIGEEIDLRRMNATQKLNLDIAERNAIQRRIEQTFALSAVTGKSIREIAASSRDFFRSNARVSGALLSLSADAASSVRSSLDFGVRVGASVGDEFSQLVNTIFLGASSMVPTATQEYLDIMMVPGFNKFSNTLLEMNSAIRSGTLTQETAREAALSMANSLLNLSDEQLSSLRLQSDLGNQTATMLLNAAMQMRSIGRDGINRMKQERVENDALIKSTAAATNAFNKFKGIFSTIFFRAITGLTGPMEAFTAALTDSSDEIDGMPSVLFALKTAVDRVFNAIMRKFGMDLASGGNSVNEMASAIREKLVPWITKTGDNLEKWITNLSGDTASEKVKSALIDGFKFLFTAALGAAVKVIQDIFNSYWKEILAVIGGMIILGVGKAAASAVMISRAGIGAAGAITVAGNQLAAALRAVAMRVGMSGRFGYGDFDMGDGGDGRRRRRGRGRGGPRGGRGLGSARMLGRASLAGIATGAVGYLASDALMNEGKIKEAAAVETLATTVGMAGTGAMIGGGIGALFGGVGAVPGSIIGGAIGGAAGLGISAAQHFDTFFNTPQAQNAIVQHGMTAIDQIGSVDLDNASLNLAAMQHFDTFFNTPQAQHVVRQQGVNFIKGLGTVSTGGIGVGSLNAASLMFASNKNNVATPLIQPKSVPIMPVSPKDLEMNSKMIEEKSSDIILVQLNERNNALLSELHTQMTEMNSQLRNLRRTSSDISINTR